MKKLNEGTLLVICFSFLFVCFNVLANDEPTALEWQTVKFQETLERKIIKSLRPVIKEEDYIIEVKIGIDKDSMESPSSKMVTKTKKTKKIKFTTDEAPKDGDDYIVFSKLGLEAPVFGEEPVETQTSEAELSQRAQIELSDRYNLFNYLKSIDINLTFDSGLSDKSKEVIRKVVQGLSFNISNVIPQINTQFLDLKANQLKNQLVETSEKNEGKGANSKLEGSLQQIESQKNVPKWFEFFKNLDLMLGLILSAAIIAISLFLIVRYYLKNAAEARANEEIPMAPEEPQTEEDHELGDTTDLNNEEEDAMKIDLTKTDPVTVKISEGLERFRKALSNHHDDTILMLKSWIKTKTEDEMNALSAIVIMLDDHELGEIFKSMTHDERSTWKVLLHSELSKEEVSTSFGFISNKITEMLMVPSLINDYETCDLLLELSSKDAVKFCQENIELGVVFTNVLSSNIIAEMFKIMPPNLVAELIDKSAYFQPEQVNELLPILKEKLERVKVKRERPPFLKRIIDILPSASLDVEEKLYMTMLKHYAIDEVKLTAIKIFPKSLASSVTDDVFKRIIALMPMDIQVQYFASLENEKRELMLNKFATKGSKGREMIDVELSVVLKNELALKRLQHDKRERLEQEFLSYARQLISSDQEIQREVIDQVEQWFVDINKKDSKQNNAA